MSAEVYLQRFGRMLPTNDQEIIESCRIELNYTLIKRGLKDVGRTLDEIDDD